MDIIIIQNQKESNNGIYYINILKTKLSCKNTFTLSININRKQQYCYCNTNYYY